MNDFLKKNLRLPKFAKGGIIEKPMIDVGCDPPEFIVPVKINDAQMERLRSAFADVLKRTEIKPCPFCGGAAEYKIRREYDGYCGYEEGVVACSECGISTPGFIIDGYYGIRYTKEQIIDIWNRRWENA